jgi:acyl carrier protein
VSVEVHDPLRTIEQVIAAHPDVKEVAAVTLDRGPGDRPAAAVVPVDFASGPEIRDYAWQRLGDGRSPETVALLPALPRNGDGNVDLPELRRILVEDDPPASGSVARRPGLEQEVASAVRAVLDLPRVGLDDDFLELGGDSLQAIEVINLLEQRTGVQVPLEDFFEAATVRKLCSAPDDD